MSNSEKVIRDNQNNVINIGDWDYKYYDKINNPLPAELENLTTPTKTQKQVIAKWDYQIEAIAENPLPQGSTQQKEEIKKLLDGTRIVITDKKTMDKYTKEKKDNSELYQLIIEQNILIKDLTARIESLESV